MIKRITATVAAVALATIGFAAPSKAASEADCGKGVVFCVGLVTDTGKVDDKSFNQSAWEGAKAGAAKIGGFAKYIETTDPKYTTMCEEIFGPVLTIYTYPASAYEKTLKLLDATSSYALTGAIIAQDRAAIELATKLLRHAAGNFYINDKPTGAVVGQQPFGGGRASGTNDKAGSMLNLYRWLSARTIKETFNPPNDYTYSFLKEA